MSATITPDGVAKTVQDWRDGFKQRGQPDPGQAAAEARVKRALAVHDHKQAERKP